MTAQRDRVLVFDVNETLLDLAALDPHFARVFGDAAVRREWFATMLQSALLLTVTGPYFDFGSHFRAALALTAERRGMTVSEADEKAILGAVRAVRLRGEQLLVQGAGLVVVPLARRSGATTVGLAQMAGPAAIERGGDRKRPGIVRRPDKEFLDECLRLVPAASLSQIPDSIGRIGRSSGSMISQRPWSHPAAGWAANAAATRARAPGSSERSARSRASTG